MEAFIYDFLQIYIYICSPFNCECAVAVTCPSGQGDDSFCEENDSPCSFGLCTLCADLNGRGKVTDGSFEPLGQP